MHPQWSHSRQGTAWRSSELAEGLNIGSTLMVFTFCLFWAVSDQIQDLLHSKQVLSLWASAPGTGPACSEVLLFPSCPKDGLTALLIYMRLSQHNNKRWQVLRFLILRLLLLLLPPSPTHFVHFRVRLFLALHGGLGKGLGVEISELNKVCSPVPSIQGNVFKQFSLYSKKCS